MTPDYSDSFSNANLLVNCILIGVFLSVAITDVTRKKIYNLQTYPAIVCGLLLGYFAGGWSGIMFSFLGLIVGLSLLLTFYMLGGVGAGDVKLLGAIGALKGSTFVIWTMFYAGLIGGAMALALIIWQGSVKQTLKNVMRYLLHPISSLRDEQERDHQYLPYGLAISGGCLWALCTV